MAFSVLDASAFYAGIPFASQEKSYTTSDVFEEIKHIKKNYDALKVLIETNRLEILVPKPDHIAKVSLKAKEFGDYQNLSQSDISVIALCLEIGGELITDDFAVSNTAKHLKLKINPIMTRGINKVKKWIYFCSGCEKTYTKISHCPICGNKLYRKPSKSSSSV